MNRSIRILLQVAGLLLTGAALLAADNTIGVIAVSDFTDQGRGTRHATPSHPVYYYPHTNGFIEAGVKVDDGTAPPTAVVQVMLLKALASQGYIYYKSAHQPASIVLVFEWGYIAPQTGPDGKKVVNQDAMNSLVEGLQPVDPEDDSLRAQHLQEATKVPRFYLTVTALDYNAMMNKKYITLWCTRASAEPGGNQIAQVLPALLQAATPIFGTQTDSPRMVDEPLGAGN